MKKLLLAAAVIFCFSAGLVDARSETGGRVKVGGDVVINEGETVQDAVAVMGNVIVKGTVEGSAVAVMGRVEVGPKGKVKGDAVSVAKSITIEEGGKISGDIVEVSGFKAISRCGFPQSKRTCGFFGFMKFVMFIGFLALAALFVALFPKYTESTALHIERDMLRSFLWGLLVVVLAMPVMLTLIMSVIGIVLVPLEIICVVAAMIAGGIIISRLIGKKIVAALAKKQLPAVWETLIGIAVLWLVALIPLIGLSVKAVAVVTGMGAIFAGIINKQKSL